VVAVKDLNIEIKKGEVFGFLGPNGSGKTTTISMLLKLIQPTKGKAHLFGQELTANSLKRVGTVMDSYGFYPNFSGRDNLTLFGGLHKPVDKKRVGEMLELVGLTDRARSKFKTYSLGMKQRLSIALALLDDPEFLILDEPTNGMDPEGIAEIRNLIKKLAGSGKTIFLASHLLSEVEQVCTHLAILKKGVAVRQGELGELLAETGRGMLEIVVKDIHKAVTLLKGAGYDAREEGGKVIIKTQQANAENVTAMLASNGVYITEMTHSRTSLEDVFMEATGNELA
jgi:ABC-2 type transport system ATP-binding protein